MLQQQPQIDLAFISFIREHRGKALGEPVGKPFVRDLTAHHLCQNFETGVVFSFYESEEVKGKKREQLRAWLSRLPNEPVELKRFQGSGTINRQKATSNNSNP